MLDRLAVSDDRASKDRSLVVAILDLGLGHHPNLLVGLNRNRIAAGDKGDRQGHQGASAKAIQELAGHTTLTMTARYMHLSPAAKDAAIKLLDCRPVFDGVEAGMEAPGIEP